MAERAGGGAPRRGLLQQELLDWFRTHARALPWRATRDPYRVLVSEVMLQQTQVARVVPFYERFLARFPDEHALAQAPLEDCHRLWKGLGYPNRVERLRATCQAVLAAGAWPRTPDGLAGLPGIGPYTAGAVACFAFGAAVPVVDTNVARVLARRDGLAPPLDRAALWRRAAAEVHGDEPIAWNNAVMELGALVCTARAPNCPECPWRARCRSVGVPQQLTATANPLKVASPRQQYGDQAVDRRLPRQHIVLALIHHDGRYLVARRPAASHAGGCWELPGGKRAAGEDDRVALAREVAEELGVEILAARSLLRFSYAYADRALTFHCYRVRLFAPGQVRSLAADELAWVTPEEFVALEFPPANVPIQERMRRYHRLGPRPG